MPIGPDVSPLRTRPTREEVRAFRRRQRQGDSLLAIGITLVLGSVVVVVYAVINFQRHEPLPSGWLVVASFMLPIGLGVIFRPTARKALTLQRFAAANGLVVDDYLPAGYYPGAPFRDRRARGASQHLAHRVGTRFDYGEVLFQRGVGRFSYDETWGFLAIPLNRSLGRVVLDGAATGEMRTFLYGGAKLDTSSILEFGSAADLEFTLYCPEAYVHDAMLVFTPDLLDILASAAPLPWMAELVDSWMFVYTSGGFDLLDPTIHSTVYAIVHNVEAKRLTKTP